MQPRSELQALLAVQIIATGFAGLRFLRQSHRQMTEDYGCARMRHGPMRIVWDNLFETE
jgi:hypothetical protein